MKNNITELLWDLEIEGFARGLVMDCLTEGIEIGATRTKDTISKSELSSVIEKHIDAYKSYLSTVIELSNKEER